MTDQPPRPARRVRYKGTHPRRFQDKYKELDPSAHPEEMDKVRRRGHTPAGTHRPICVAEILELLAPAPGERALDATLGYGGHAAELLARLRPGGGLLGLDVDPLQLPRTEARLRELGFGPEAFQTRRMNFAGLVALAAEAGPWDLILADLGVSSMQIDDPQRGFTFKAEGPLDLRMNPRRGQPASALLRRLKPDELRALLEANADEPFAERLALDLAGGDFPTTTALASAIRALPLGQEPDELRRLLQRVFQALRIAVNDEFGALDPFLAALPSALAPGGRVAILSFHSGEDRRVKKAFQEGLRAGHYARIAPEPLRPGPAERRDNPRSACAKLRWAVKA